MTRAASSLFTAECREELEGGLERWATDLFPGATAYILTDGPDASPADAFRPNAPSEAVRALALEEMTTWRDTKDARGVQWIEPSAESIPSSVRADQTELPNTIALFPLPWDASAPGAVLLVYSEEAPSDGEREAVNTFAEMAHDACSAFASRPLADPLQTAEAGRLIEVANTIASQLELVQVIGVVAEQTSQLLNADRSSVWLHDEEAGEIYTIVAEQLGAEEIRMPDDCGVAGHVLHTETPLNLEDASNHPAFDPSHDRNTGYRTQSMLCVPLHDRQGETLGVFQVMNKQDAPVFSPHDAALLETLAGSASVAIETALLYEEQRTQFESFIEVLATTIDSRDPTTGQHTIMVTGLAVLIAEEMELPPSTIESIRVAGILHDVGKVVLPDQVLRKQGDLTAEEYEIAQSHVRHTIRILDRIHFHRDLDDVPEIAGAHHERLDGEGYPRGLSAESLSVPMRILAVADVFHALIQDRPYKESFSIEEAVEECRRISASEPNPPAGEQAHLDPQVVEALVQNITREGTKNFRERVIARSGFTEQNVFAPQVDLER